MYLLDTDVIIDIQRDHAPALAWFDSLTELPAVPDFTAYHLSHNLGLLDSLIAACATSRSATLCTFNTKHYRIIPNLVMVQPYQR